MLFLVEIARALFATAVVLLLAIVQSTYFLLGKLLSRRGVSREDNIRITKLCTTGLVHPIKSCGGLSVPEFRYDDHGAEYDRKWVIVQHDGHKFITARQHSKMVLIKPTIHVDKGELEISFPSDSGVHSFSISLDPTEEVLKTWEYITDIGFWGDKRLDGYVVQSVSSSSSEQKSPSELVSQFLGLPVFLIQKGPIRRAVKPTPVFPSLGGEAQFQDRYPLFLASEESLQDLRRYVSRAAAVAEGEVKEDAVHWRLGRLDGKKWKNADKLHMERFRPNIVIAGVSGPWLEDTWAEISVESGWVSGENSQKDCRISLVTKGTRCLLPNIGPETGVRDDAVPYKVMSMFRNVDPEAPNTPCFGVHALPVSGDISGKSAGERWKVLRVGDRVRVTRNLSHRELAVVLKSHGK